MIEIIHKTCGGSVITVDGVSYSCKQFEKLTLGDLAKIQDRMILKLQDEFREQKNAIYDAFEPYMEKAKIREEQQRDYIALAQMIQRMPREDVIAVFTAYFNELLSKVNGDDSKNE